MQLSMSGVKISRLLSYSFKVVYDQLRALKTEIEHVQHLHEKAKLQIQRSFEQWWHQMVGKKEVGDLAHYIFSLTHHFLHFL